MDKERILSKIDELDSYLGELEKIKLSDFEEYKNSIKDKRACERLLQISIECVVDICNLIITGLKLGLPYDEEETFEKLEQNKIIPQELKKILVGMKGFRNILVHKYGNVNNEIVFEMFSDKLGDFDKFKDEIILFLKKHKEVK